MIGFLAIKKLVSLEAKFRVSLNYGLVVWDARKPKLEYLNYGLGHVCGNLRKLSQILTEYTID